MREQLIKDLVSYPFMRRGNWQLKVSVLKNMHVLVVGNNVFDVEKFFVKSFTNLENAAIFIEMIIIKDDYDNGH
jgi:hypothetical protein